MQHHGDGFEPRLVSQFFNRPFLFLKASAIVLASVHIR